MQVDMIFVVALLAAAAAGSHDADGDTSAGEYVVHVSQRRAPGAAAADGSTSAPFPTIHAARDHLRTLRHEAGGASQRSYRVVIGAGTYAPLRLEAQDSGSPGRPVVYESDRSHGPAVVSAGVQVPKATFRPYAGHPGVLTADLSSLNVDYGSMAIGGGNYGDCTGYARAALVFSNTSMVLARWPNVNSTSGKYVWEKIKLASGKGFTVHDPAAVARMAKWGAEPEPWLHSYPQIDYADTWAHINVSASATEVNITVTDPVSLARGPSRGNDAAASASTVAMAAGATITRTGVAVGSAGSAATVRKRIFFAPCYTKNDHFTKTGSGQTHLFCMMLY